MSLEIYDVVAKEMFILF